MSIHISVHSHSGATTIILGRPFLKTTRTKIDGHASTLTMEFGDSLVQFNILDDMKHSVEDHFVYLFWPVDLLAC